MASRLYGQRSIKVAEKITIKYSKIKNKNHGPGRDFRFVLKATRGLGRFHQRANALGAQNFTHLLPVLENCNSLKIGTKGSSRGFVRPGAVAAERGCFSTVCTLCHISHFLSYTIPGPQKPGKIFIQASGQVKKHPLMWSKTGYNYTLSGKTCPAGLSGRILPQIASYYKPDC